jgi:hypothetical protein
MNLILKTTPRYLMTLTSEDLTGILNALNEVCNGLHFSESEFQTRLGHNRSELMSLLQKVGDAIAAKDADDQDMAEAWSDGASVQVRAINVYGDPVDWGTGEALEFAELINRCVHEAGGAP